MSSTYPLPSSSTPLEKSRIRSSGSVVQKFVLAYFHFSPLQLPAAPLISLGSGMQPSGSPELSQRLGLARKGSSAPAGTASNTTASSGSASRRFMGPPPAAETASAGGYD